jgi:hypothetical protein
VAGLFNIRVTPADAYGNPSTKVFVTAASDRTNADSLVASSNLLASRVSDSNVLGVTWVEFAANTGDVGIPAGSHEVVAEGAVFALAAPPNRTGEGLVISVRTTNAPGDTTGITQPHTIAFGRTAPLAFFAEGDVPTVLLQPAPPDTVVVTDYLGADNKGDQGGFVVVTFPPSKDGEARDRRVNHYRVYRQITVRTAINDFGELVETDENLAFVSWAVIYAPPEDTLITAIVPAIDHVETKWAVAGEYGGESSEPGHLAKPSVSPTDNANAEGIQALMAGLGFKIAQPTVPETDANSVRAYRYTPPSDDTQPKPDNNPPTIARFDPQLARLVSAKLASTPMTISEPARAIDDIPPAPVTNLLITQESELTTLTWSPSEDDRPVGSIPYRGFAIPIPGVARYRILAGSSASDLISVYTVPSGTTQYEGILAGTFIRVDAEDLDNVAEGPVLSLESSDFLDADGNPVYILIFDGTTPFQQDFEDFIEFAGAFAAQESDENYNILADIDRDGEVSFADFITFIQAFNRIAVDPTGMGSATKATRDVRIAEGE